VIYLIIANFYFHIFSLQWVPFLGGTVIWSRDSKGKLWEGFFPSYFVPSFFLLFLFGWCSLGQVNPRLIQAIHQASHLSSQEWGVGGNAYV
jgi:hypothetical protein